MSPILEPVSGQNALSLTWSALASRHYQVEHSIPNR